MDNFPFLREDFFLAVARHLALQGFRTEVGITAAAKTKLHNSAYDNWDGGRYGWTIDIAIDQQVYALMTEEQRVMIEGRIAAAANETLRGYNEHYVENVLLVMDIPKASRDWREQAKTWASGSGLNNQGRVRSDNLAHTPMRDCCFVREQKFIFFKHSSLSALRLLHCLYFIKGGETYRRIEPDFLLMEDGTAMVVEVDGDHFHHEKPADAHERLAMLTREGVAPERVKSLECDSPEKAQKCAEKLVGILRKHARRR